METFAEVRQHVASKHDLIIDEPFLLCFESKVGNSDRRQSMFLAEVKASDGRRFLRVETPIAPLADLDPEKCLRINWIQRVGYLSVRDMEDTPFIMACENMPYATLAPSEIEYVVNTLARFADMLEEALEPGGDLT